MHRPRRRHRKMIEDLPLTPLIDTALTLLVIFMVSSPMIHNAIKINLPQGKAKEDTAFDQNITVFIDKDQSLYLNEKRMDLQELIAQLSPDVLARNDGMVYIKGDRDASYGCVTEVVDKLKLVKGVHYVALATKKYA